MISIVTVLIRSNSIYGIKSKSNLARLLCLPPKICLIYKMQ